MKKRIYLLFSLSLLSPSCSKDAVPTAHFTSDYDFSPLFIKAHETKAIGIKKIENLDEEPWQLNTSTIYLNGFDELTFICSAYNDTLSFYEREQIVFYNLSLKEQRIKLPNDNHTDGFARYQRLIGDGDIVDAQWNMIEGSDSYIEFSNIDTLKRTISGHFEVHFVRDTVLQLDGIHSYSDKISFIDVHFEVGY